MVIIQNPVNESMEKDLEQFQDEFKESIDKVSELRKAGKNTKIAEVIILSIPPKFKMVKVTWETDDYQNLRRNLDELKEEIKYIEAGDPFENMLEIIHNIYVALFDKKVKDASKEYNKLIEMYKGIKESDLKKMVYPVCIGLHKRIVDADKV